MLKKTVLRITSCLVAIAIIAGALPVQAQTTYSFNQNLTIGSQGQDVSMLQTFLESRNFLVIPTGVSKGYFGSLTRSALGQYQLSVGISPAVGYFGPITRSHINSLPGGGTPPVATPGCLPGALFNTQTGEPCGTIPGCPAGALFNTQTGAPCGTTPNPTPPTSGLTGNNGIISNVDLLSPYSNEEIAEGQRNVRVAGIEVEASSDGDIRLRSMRISLDSTGNAGSTRLDRYIDSVSVWMGDTKIGETAVNEFSRNGNINSRTLSLNSSAVIRANQSENIYLAINAARNIDSADIVDDSWTINVDNIRFEDGSGVLTTDNSTGAINDLNVPINFVSFSDASDTKLKLSLDSGSPAEGLVLVDEARNTNNVTLLKGKIAIEGSSDVTLDELPITLTVTGTASDVNAVTGTVRLTIDNKEFTETLSTNQTTATVVFDRLRLNIDAGDTVTFTVAVDINDIDPGTFDEGDTIKAEITSTNRDNIDAENEQGDQLSNSNEKSGIVIGKTLELRTSGISTTLVSTNTSVSTGGNANDDAGLFTIRYRVQALGDNVYVSSVANAAGLSYTIDKSRVAVTSGNISAVVVNVTDSTLTSNGNYLIEEGETETFELTVRIGLDETNTSGLYSLVLNGIKWDSHDNPVLSEIHTYNLSSYRTSYVGLN